MKKLFFVLFLIPVICQAQIHTMETGRDRQRAKNSENKEKKENKEDRDTEYIIKQQRVMSVERYVDLLFLASEKETVETVQAVIPDYEVSQQLKREDLTKLPPKSFPFENVLPPVPDDNEGRKCAAYVSAYYMKTIGYNLARNHNLVSAAEIDKYIFNPNFILAVSKKDEPSCDVGIQLEEAASIIKHFGALTNKEVRELTNGHGINCYKPVDPKLIAAAEVHQSRGLVTLQYSESEIKSRISLGIPVGLVAQVDASFEEEGKKEIYTSGTKKFSWNSYSSFLPDKKTLFSHAMVIVGYDETSYKIATNLGVHWGNKGYVYIPFDFINKKIKVNNEDKVETITPVSQFTYLIECANRSDYFKKNEFVHAKSKFANAAFQAPEYSGKLVLKKGEYNLLNDYMIGLHNLNKENDYAFLFLHNIKKDKTLYSYYPLKKGRDLIIKMKSEKFILKLKILKFIDSATLQENNETNDAIELIVKRKKDD